MPDHRAVYIFSSISGRFRAARGKQIAGPAHGANDRRMGRIRLDLAAQTRDPNIDRAVYQELFHLNETEAGRIASLVPRQQLLLKRPDLAKVLYLTVDPESAKLFGEKGVSR